MTTAKLSKMELQNKLIPELGASFPKLNEKAIRAAQDGKNDKALTSQFPLYRKKIIALLQIALASELVNMLRYRYQYSIVSDTDTPEISKDLLKYANQELAHADKVAKRIFELNGVANFSPKLLTKYAHTTYKTPEHISPMLKSNLTNGRVMVETYRQMIACVTNYDAITRQILEVILADEEKRLVEQNNHLIKQTQTLTVES